MRKSISVPYINEISNGIGYIQDEIVYRKLFFYYLDHFLDMVIKKTINNRNKK